MNSIRPEGATHTDSAGSYYKPGVELNWYRWNGELGNWFICGTMPSGSLTPLPPVHVVELRPLEDWASALRPEAATHISKVTSEYYKPNAISEGWMRWGVGAGWYPVGDMNLETLTLLAPQIPSAVSPSQSTKCERALCLRERLIGSKFCLVHGASPQPLLPGGFHETAPFTSHFMEYRFVGSRITCNPPPLNTDQDVLVLVWPADQQVCERKMLEDGFVIEGSNPTEMDASIDKESVFHSYRKGDMNYIVTTDEAFYQRFSTATELARKYNLMNKSDRIQLFQAVLYGKWWA